MCTIFSETWRKNACNSNIIPFAIAELSGIAELNVSSRAVF
jgi:hypothetical protein